MGGKLSHINSHLSEKNMFPNKSIKLNSMYITKYK